MIVEHVRGHQLHTLDEHVERSWLGRLDARAKLVGVLAFVVASALMTEPRLIAASLAVSLSLALLSAIPPSHLLRAYLGALPFVLLASLSVFIVSGTDAGLAMWGRTSACIVALLVLASGTESFDLFTGLRRLKVPAIITTLLMLTHRFIGTLSEEFSRMSTARKARGFRPGKSLLDSRGLKVLSYTAGMLLVRAYARGDRAYEGLRSKGFSMDMQAWKASRLGAPDAAFALCLMLISAAFILAQAGVVA